MLAVLSLLIGNIVARNAAQVPGRLAAWMSGTALSHGALNASANHTARALRELGVAHGDRVVVWADTDLALLPLFVALSKLGAVFAPLNARLGPREAGEVAALARASLAVSKRTTQRTTQRTAKPIELRFRLRLFQHEFRNGIELHEGRSFVDLGDFRISQVLLGATLLGHPDSAVDVHTAARHRLRDTACHELGHRRLANDRQAGLAALDLPGVVQVGHGHDRGAVGRLGCAGDA